MGVWLLGQNGLYPGNTDCLFHCLYLTYTDCLLLMVDIEHKRTGCLWFIFNTTPDWLFIHFLFQHHLTSDLSQGTAVTLIVCVSM